MLLFKVFFSYYAIMIHDFKNAKSNRTSPLKQVIYNEPCINMSF